MLFTCVRVYNKIQINKYSTLFFACFTWVKREYYRVKCIDQINWIKNFDQNGTYILFISQSVETSNEEIMVKNLQYNYM